ncbi:MAG: amidohydrolase [Acidimicrobiaceae bacterium]|nr:amidohydrolase [Acidimicrobiaceae bacterium]
MTTGLIIDCDTHVSEPTDLWTSRLGKKWGDRVPHVVTEPDGREFWTVGGNRIAGSGQFAPAGWAETSPPYPPTLAAADPASWDPAARLHRMDEYGLHAQVLYPNILAFYMPLFFRSTDLELTHDCIRAYNDFLTEFAAEDPNRLVPLMLLPFWDVELATAEMTRCASAGHKGIVFANSFTKVGLPQLWDPHWNPIFELAQTLELSINFHIGFGALSEDEMKGRMTITGAEHSRVTPIGMLANAQAIADITTMGICHRFPRLNFVSVESGVSWIPYLLESLDWHWKNYLADRENPDMDLPSDYFRRQVYGSFWFEREAIRRVIDLLPDNVMFESDFPHPTSLSPGPLSISDKPSEMAHASLNGVADDIKQKVLHDTAARIYHL